MVSYPADILQIDARFVSLVKMAWRKSYSVSGLSGDRIDEDGYAVYKIRETAFRRRNEAFSRGWIPAVYDRTSSGK